MVALVLPALLGGWIGAAEAHSKAIPPTGDGPSFSCAAPKAVEALICADPALAARDRTMAELFAAARTDALSLGPSLQQDEQRKWLKSRDARCSKEAARSCLVAEYDSRIQDLAVGALFRAPQAALAEFASSDAKAAAILEAILRYATIESRTERTRVVEGLIAPAFADIQDQPTAESLFDDVPNARAAASSDQAFATFLDVASVSGYDLQLPWAAPVCSPGRRTYDPLIMPARMPAFGAGAFVGEGETVMKIAALASIVVALAASPCLAASPPNAVAATTTVSAQAVNDAIAKVQAAARQAVKDGAVPGVAIAVVYDDKLVWAEGFGVRDTASAVPVDADTVFQLASVSKPLASTVVAELVGEGKISWDSKISDLDPSFQLSDPWVTREVRIADLLAHRSGLPDHAGDLLEDIGFSRAEILRRLRYQKAGGAFRASYAYTNFGFTEGAVAAAKPSGLEWEDAAQTRLYGPLGMTSTSSRYSDFLARPDRALGHVRVDGRWVAKYKRDPQTQSPAGGASSSVNDMAKWVRLQLADGKFEGRQIVDAAALAQTHLPQFRTGQNPLTGAPQFYGLGWNVSYDQQGRLRLSHSGGFALGASTTVSLVPAEHLGIVVLVNAAPVGVAEGLAFSFMDQAVYARQTQDWMALMAKVFADPAALGITMGADYSKPPAAPSAALTPGAYVGTYANDYFGDVEVIEHGERLAIVEGPERMTFPLTHYDRDTFTYLPSGENAEGASGVTFTLAPDGKANTVTVENLNIHGNGVFPRKPAA